ncbi:MAG: hypothetical protein ABI431_03810 [Candidatus Tumulicola sp.]
MTAILVLLAFAVFAVLMYVRVLPALIAVPAMGLTMALAAGVHPAALGSIVTGGVVALAPVYAAVVFGALLGRVTLDTGIARAMVNVAAEYGGEKPLWMALGLCAVVALLFTSLSGLGAIIMVGSVALPIMMTTGVPRPIAATLFLMAFALGFIFNAANWTFYTTYFSVGEPQLFRYALVLAAIDAVALVVYACVSFARHRGYATWAVRAKPDERQGVPAIAMITPLLPLALYYGLHLDAVPAFLIAAVFGAVVARPKTAIATLVAAGIRGVEDVAPALLLFMGIGILATATKQPQFVAALHPLIGAWLRNPIAYVVVFGLTSPLTLYRGPLNPFGVGIAVFTVLASSHVLAAVVLVAAVMAVVQVQNVCDPTNTANVWIANFTGVQIETLTKRTLPYQVGVAVLATLAVVLLSSWLFGAQAFASALAAARAAVAEPPGLYAPAQAAGRIGVEDDGGAFGRAATAATIGALNASGTGLAAAPAQGDANLTDCSAKPFAAYADVLTSTFQLIEGTDLDVGIRLEDCGGWIVNEWHDHRVFAAPSVDDAAALARESAARLLEWSHAQPARSHALFQRGLAVLPSDPPTYLYSLFKTVDGQMRTYVRAGGPAYVAGLRTDDIVDTVDGKFWWEYGTYQTQQRAYDGKPHVFGIHRGTATYEIRLGDPLVKGSS